MPYGRAFDRPRTRWQAAVMIEAPRSNPASTIPGASHAQYALRALCAMLVALGLAFAGCADLRSPESNAGTTAGPPVLPGSATPAILALIDDVGFERPQADGLVVDSAQIQRDRVRFEVHAAAAVDAPALATLTLLPIEAAEAADARSTSFALRVAPGAAPRAGPLLLRLVQSVQTRDHGGLYARPTVPAPGPTPLQRALAFDLRLLQGALAALAAALLGSLVVARRRGARLRWPKVEVRVTHLLPAALQCTIFAYWSLYWRDLGPRVVPMIAMELVAALLFDAIVELWTARRWVVSSGALPIVLSTNLFVVFEPGAVGLTLAALTLALLSRRWIRSGDRHVFNPSVFGLTLVGCATLVAPQLGYGDTAYEFSLAPNATELVLVLATIVQLRLPLVLVSFGAFAGLLLASKAIGGVAFEPTWAPIALVLTLLVTDPATIPRRPATRLLFGLCAGASMRVAGEVMHGVFALDNFAKVTGVFVANAGAVLALRLRVGSGRWPRLEALLARLDALLDPRWNLGHVALWWLLMGSRLLLTDVKAEALDHSAGIGALHVQNGTPFVRPGADGLAHCADNPMFCAGFSWATEARCWISGQPGGACGPGPPGHALPSRGHNSRVLPRPGPGRGDWFGGS